VPLYSRDRFLGILSVFEREERLVGSREGFKEDDLSLLLAMASYISNALEQAITLRKIEKLISEKEAMVRELSILHSTSLALMGARRLEKALKIILSAITLGDGLGFNRAILFLINERTNTLDGKMAVGPESGEDAARIWNLLSRQSRSLTEWLMSEEMEDGFGTKIDRVIKTIHIPIDDARCLLTKSITQKQVYNVKVWNEKYGIDLLKDIEIADEFAIVPIISKGKALGVILVDNIYTKKEITQEDIRFLQTFANHAAIAIENSILYENLQFANDELRRIQERLIHSERLAALGEFSANLAHELRNPLVTIGGYARRLEKELNNHYASVILKEVNRLENLLNDILTFSKIDQESFVDADLNQVLEDCLFSLKKEITDQNIEVIKELTNDLPKITCDVDQIKQAFLNMIKNSIQAMKDGGTLTLRTYISYEMDQVHVVSEIEDTGGGIPVEILHNIFNPFFTTKDFGTGLGLAISHRIVSNHNGFIEVKNIPNSGCCFTVKIPIAD
jgi:signal transduction histidine kinase